MLLGITAMIGTLAGCGGNDEVNDAAGNEAVNRKPMPKYLFWYILIRKPTIPQS